jgi:hypothetical protein
MKTLLLSLVLSTLFLSHSEAQSVRVVPVNTVSDAGGGGGGGMLANVEDDGLVCRRAGLQGISCVSKVSMERDMAQLQLIKLQIKQLNSKK